MNNKLIIELIPTISEGGAETLVKDYCLLLKEKNINIEIVTLLPPSPKSSNFKILLDNNISITSLDKNRFFYKNWFFRNLWRYTIRPFYASFKLAKLIHKKKPYCIHAHLRMLEYLSRILPCLSDIKLFYTCHSKPQLMFDTKRSYLEKRGAIKLIKNCKLQLIALHDEMRQELNAMFNINNTIVIHNGINFNKFNNLKIDKKQYRESIGFSENDFIIGHVGRFNPVKNHNFLLKVFTDVINKKTNAKLLLIGDGAFKDQVEKQIDDLGIRNRCIILEHRSDIPQLLSIMNVFLFPSLYEGLPVTLVEAQVIGLRCIVSNTITKECFFNKNTVPIGLNEPIEVWSKAVVDETIKGNFHNDITKFDMNSVINYLSYIYFNEK